MSDLNINQLPDPVAVDQLEYDAIVLANAARAQLENASPSDPAYRVMLANSYRELLVRQDFNERSKSVMLAYASGGYLDHIGTTYYRDPNGSPVVRLLGETDDNYRARLQLSPEGLSVAGPEEAYRFHCRSASPLIKDVGVDSPAPVSVVLSILTNEGDGTPSPELLQRVDNYIQPFRPFTDQVLVQPTEILGYSIEARLWLRQGAALVEGELLSLSQSRAQGYVDYQHRRRGRAVGSGVNAALTVEGVEQVDLIGWSDVVATELQAPYCTALNVTIAGYV
ncbi:baseplate J/gp47 family protein [Pontibacterium sp.]|uniref:baseplate assembly protein n=1 Tax=Pontibacterium sp. TaxID=2036026 RepID=UPI00356AEAA2